MQVDVAIIGAGPIGLAFARALVEKGVSIALIEKQAQSAIESPNFDGREIALTHASYRMMKDLGILSFLPKEAIYDLKHAQVFNGHDIQSMRINADMGRRQQLGFLVSNHDIRRASYQALQSNFNDPIFYETTVSKIQRQDQHVELQLDNGHCITARLLVAADNRFSQTRRTMGIGAQMRDFGKTMLVCRVEHELAHQHTAWEWFDYGQTSAILPLKEHQCSIVLTQTQLETEKINRLDVAAFSDYVTTRYQARLGQMKVTSDRHIYPLVGVYAHRFVGERFALIGDAAVGMHPVTAHGYNLGLLSATTLSDLILTHRSCDIGRIDLLERYQRAHRLATFPLYSATYAITKLFTDDRAPAKLVRQATLKLADHFYPFKRLIASQLTHVSI